MAMLGQAALALWFDVSGDVRPELEHWHAHEHFPERLSIPGFLRGSRWASACGETFFVLYELQDHGVLASAPYVARLNAPSPWSTRMMPLHRQMVRTQCRVLLSQGGVAARHVLTIRCSLRGAPPDELERALGELAASLSRRPGIVGLHVLRHDAPALATTTEQRIRGNADQAADWVIVACGYELAALQALGDAELGTQRLQAMGAVPQVDRDVLELAWSATPGDVR